MSHQTTVWFGVRQLEELLLAQSPLGEILADLARIWPHRVMRVGDIHRTAEENAAARAKSQIHVVGPPYRSSDVGARELGMTIEERWAGVADLAKRINRKWQYDPTRPGRYAVAYGAKHGNAPHLHLQVTRHTRRREA